MITRIRSVLSALLALSAFSLSAYAAEKQNISELSIPQQCQQLFSATEKLIADAEKQPGTHTQVSKIKNKLTKSKKQILEMELATQIKSCDHGLARLNNLKADQEQPEPQDN